MVQFGKSLEMFEMPLKINGTFYSGDEGNTNKYDTERERERESISSNGHYS